jgi:primase-polymerase (primpol)-like protein
MTTLLEEFDEVKKHISTREGKDAAKKFRKQLKDNEKYASKLDTYFTDTIDGMEPSRSATELGLL